jgi:hypothetical protein
MTRTRLLGIGIAALGMAMTIYLCLVVSLAGVAVGIAATALGTWLALGGGHAK